VSNLSDNKFKDQKVTADGSNRAFIEARNIKTLWFNTGTLCNIECKNCYIESSPKNDSLTYLTFEEVKSFIDEAIDKNLGTNEIGFTGGEPFMNKDIMKMIDYSLNKNFKVLVLSNAMKPMLNRTKELIKLNHSNLTIRVSIDHYKKEKHEEIRGKNTYDVMLQGLKWLNENNFNYTLATRLLWNEKEEDLRRNFGTFIKNNN
jgi:MoaA/NifB/PqqE/SkfB family radical SAM enzyme